MNFKLSSCFYIFDITMGRSTISYRILMGQFFSMGSLIANEIR